MVISWLGSLAVLLNRFWNSLFRIEHIEESYNETVKRFLFVMYLVKFLRIHFNKVIISSGQMFS